MYWSELNGPEDKEILAILEKEYGDLKPGLTYESPFQLLIAVILSAQCTDVRVNKVTSRLFAKYKKLLKIL